MISLTINNKTVSVPDGSTILDAAKLNNIDIPHLCYLEGVHQNGTCRLCVVEVEGIKKLQASCLTRVKEGMVVHTDTERVSQVRKINYEILLSNYQEESTGSQNNQHNELKALGIRLGVTTPRLNGEIVGGEITISPDITHTRSQCILCRRCVAVCHEIKDGSILNVHHRAFKTIIGTAMDQPINTEVCSSCGRCVEVCPVGAMKKTTR